MKIIKLLILIFLISFNSQASEFQIKSVEELLNDISARTLSRQDNNGNSCAIVRLDIPSIDKINFGEMVIGDYTYLPGEYLIYLSPFTENLNFSIGNNDYSIDFKDYDIEIEGKKSYRIILENKHNNSLENNYKTIIKGTYDKQVILLDGIPMGETPLQIEGLTPGEYALSVPNIMGITANDTIIKIEDGRDNFVEINMYEKEFDPLNLQIASLGGDTAGWEYEFGIEVLEKDGKYGLVDYCGNIIVPFNFEYIYPSKLPSGSYMVRNRDENNIPRYGLYKPGEGLIVPCIYTSLLYYKDFFIVSKDKKYSQKGVIDGKGQIMVPLKYKQIIPDENGIRVNEVREGYFGYWGLYDYKGNLLIDPYISLCEDLGPYEEGYCGFEDRSGSGLINNQGKKKYLDKSYSIGKSWGGDDDPIIKNGLLRIFNKETEKWGYVNKDFKTVIPFKYEGRENSPLPNFNKGYSFLEIGDKYILIDEYGNEILNLDKEKDNLYRVRLLKTNYTGEDPYKSTYLISNDRKNTEGIWDINGRCIVKNGRYKDLWDITDGEQVYFIAYNDMEGNEDVLDAYGNLVVSLPPKMYVNWIQDQIISIKDSDSGTSGYIDINGNILANSIYSQSKNIDSDTRFYLDVLNQTFPISEGLAVLNIGDKFGFIDRNGKIIVPLIYSAVTPFKNGEAFVRDKQGNWKKIYRDKL